MKTNDKKIIVQASELDGENWKRVCPNCGKEKSKDDFGMRNMTKEKKEQRNQSWCKECR